MVGSTETARGCAREQGSVVRPRSGAGLTEDIQSPRIYHSSYLKVHSTDKSSERITYKRSPNLAGEHICRFGRLQTNARRQHLSSS